MSRTEISKRLGTSYGQVKHNIQSGRTSLGRSTSRPPSLMIEQEDELEVFVRGSSEFRQINYLELAMNFRRWDVENRRLTMPVYEGVTINTLP